MYVLRSCKDAGSVELARVVGEYLIDKGIEFVSDEGCFDAKMVFAVGDDRFILSTFKEFGARMVPVLGISPGVGVLGEATSENYRSVINSIERGEYSIVERARLVARFNGKETPFALNEIGIFPKRSAELLRYNLNIDNEHFFKDTADGVIVSTPTGSTGYAMSAGGPMVVDEPDVFTVTPVSSMYRSFAPLVVCADSKMRISSIQAKSGACVVVDGVDRISVDCDYVDVFRSDCPALFVKPKDSRSIVDKLRKRAFKVNHEMIRDLSPSAKLVYKALAYEGEMTQKELIAETYLPARTVRYAVEILVRKNVIAKKPNLNDVRQTVYSV